LLSAEHRKRKIALAWRGRENLRKKTEVVPTESLM